MPPALPWKIEDRYTIVAEIGHGSHAIVYRAIDRMLEREVAIKVLRAELVDSDIGERFRREIRLTSQLAHPNIAHVYGTGEFMGSPYFVIELARGRSLAERLAIEPQLPVDEAFAITRQVASALGHAHRAGIIHRDVKPANILLTPDGALLTDFGVARAIDAGVGTLATSTGT
ncbi:MAG TPA: serine/threonine-protein kinase, partial [Gemmatimonadaceae bacterium]|nr:serine/threonine-protein kinase [Gemmatimonadaceae bacterium]